MNGLINKSNGIGLLIIGLGFAWLQDEAHAWYQGALVILLGCAVMALRHAIHKGALHGKAVERLGDAAAPLLLCTLLLGGCMTTPADQTSKEEAGRSEVKQQASSVHTDLRHLLPRHMKIESPGEVHFVFNFHGTGERTNDISLSNQGSTTSEMAATQSQTQTPTSTPTVDTDVSGLPGQ